jgi:trimeric autotransporter adhesin
MTAVGSDAGAVNTGTRNVFVGFESGNDNTSAGDNTAVGAYSLDANTTGGSNNAFGVNALGANTTGANNVAVGSHAMGTNTTGVRNVAVGHFALYENVSGNYNTAIGYEALNIATVSNNTAVGYHCLVANTTGSNNTAVGYQALVANTTGLQNTAVGDTAGDVITTGSQNICIGYATDPSANNGLGQITIGYGLAGQGNYHVTMGTSSSKIYVNYSSTGTWTQTSDATLKNVIGEDSLGLSFINRLNPVTFTWKPQNELSVDHPHYSPTNKKDTSVVMHGLLAQDVKAAMDAEGCTTFNGWDQGLDGVQAVSREMFISPLIKAIQELSAKCDSLQAEINTLKGQ